MSGVPGLSRLLQLHQTFRPAEKGEAHSGPTKRFYRLNCATIANIANAMKITSKCFPNAAFSTDVWLTGDFTAHWKMCAMHHTN